MVVIAIPASKLGPIGRPIIPAFVNIDSHVVIAGLDPAIHPFAKTLAKKMDARVKPGHDGFRLFEGWYKLFKSLGTRFSCWTDQGYNSHTSDKNPVLAAVAGGEADAMLTHAQIWTALDRLAARAGLSPSGLAKKAGLDPTTFNKSKRITPDGRQRWPSTESVAKSLAATGTGIGTFVQLIEDTGPPGAQAVPLIGFAQAGIGGYFDDGGFP